MRTRDGGARSVDRRLVEKACSRCGTVNQTNNEAELEAGMKALREASLSRVGIRANS